MSTVSLGPDGPRVSRVVLGTMAYGSHRSASEQIATVHAALDAGVTALDTAPLYHFGAAETHLAVALRGRDALVLGKVGLRWDAEHGDVLFAADVEGTRRVVRKDARPASVRADVEQSLRRLRREALDVCQLHHPDVHTPIEDTMGELLRLRAEGKLRHIGACNLSADQLDAARAALGDVPLCSHQFEYSLLAPQGRDALGHATRAGIGSLYYSPLRRGVLAGAVRRRGRLRPQDPRVHDPAFVGSNARTIDQAIEATLAPAAAEHRVTVAQMALAWLLHQPGEGAVIVGASSAEQACANVEAAALELDPQTVERIGRAFTAIRIDPAARPRKRDRVERKIRRVLRRVKRRILPV